MALQEKREIENSYSRLFILITSVASQALKYLLERKGSCTQDGNIQDFLTNNQVELSKLLTRKKDFAHIIDFVMNNTAMDVSLLCKLLFHFFGSEKRDPNIPDNCVMCEEEEKLVTKIKTTRDKLAHTRQFDENDFLQMWTSVYDSLGELCRYLMESQSEDIKIKREAVLLRQTQCNISIESLRHFEEYHGDMETILLECMRLEFPQNNDGITRVKMKCSGALQKLKSKLLSNVDFVEHQNQRILSKTTTLPLEVRIQCKGEENSSDIADILLSVFKLACCSEESLPSSPPLSEALSSAVMRLVKQIQSRHAVDSVKGKKGSVLLDIGAMSERGILDIIQFLESDSAEETLQEIANALYQETDRKVKISVEINEEAVIALTEEIEYPPAEEDVTVDVSKVNMCASHFHNTYTHFCEDHEEPACLDCITNNHKECKNIVLITDKATKHDIEKYQEQAETLKREFEENSMKTNQLFADLLNAERGRFEYIEKIKADFDQKLKKEKQRIEDDWISRYIKSNRCIIDQQNILVDLKKQVKALEDATSKDEVTQFLQAELTKKTIEPITEELKAIKNTVLDMSREIEPVVEYVPADRIVDIPSKIDRVSSFHSSKIGLSLKLEHDKNLDESWITGCLIHNGILILCDRLQGSLLLFSSVTDQSVCYELKLEHPPYGICVAKKPKHGTFLVTIPEKKEYAKGMVDHSHRSLSLQKPHFSTSGECYGIASDEDKVYVTCNDKTNGGYIEVRNIYTGELLQTIGERILQWPTQVRLTRENGISRIYVADWQGNNVVCFSKDWWPDFKIRVSGPCDFVVKDDGDIVVCASTMHELSVISQNRDFPKVILRHEDGLSHPTSIALSEKWLVVGMMNKLQLYTII